MSIRLHNPYHGKQGEWVRANLHGHCDENSPCASVPLRQGAQMYHEIGTRVMAVTDHDAVTDLAEIQDVYRDMVFLHGFEYSSRENVVFIGEHVPRLYELPLEEAFSRADGLLTIICHPQPRRGTEYWTHKKIVALGRMPDGIEVYNGHYGIERMLTNGCNPYYAPFWDELLTAGHHLWGFANDDFHDPPDFNNAFNMILVDELTPRAVIHAAQSGCCYATTGLLLDRIEESDGCVAVTVDAPCTGRFIGPGGRTLSKAEGTRFEFTMIDEAYVRFEADGEQGRLFLQPLFRI